MKLAMAVLASLAAVGAHAEALQPVACGVRATLWIEHYRAQLYVPKGASLDAVGDPGKPKMLRMTMLNTVLMPPEIPRKWREALQPVLDGEAMKRLQDSYVRLRDGDRVEVRYEPANGIALRINGRMVLSSAGHAAIEALLAAWAEGAAPLEKLSDTAARHRCV